MFLYDFFVSLYVERFFLNMVFRVMFDYWFFVGKLKEGFVIIEEYYF